jgi:hypothetical protein
LVLLVVSLVLLVVARVLPSEEIVNSCDAVLRISHVVASCLMTVSVH